MDTGLKNRRKASAKPKQAPAPSKRRRVAGIDDSVPLLLYTVEQAAQALNISEAYARRMICRNDRGEFGGLRAVTIGQRMRRVPVWEIERFARALAGESADTVPDAQGVWLSHGAAMPTPFGRGV